MGIITKMLDKIRAKNNNKNFETQTLKVRMNTLLPDIEVDIRVPTEHVAKLGSPQQWSSIIRNSLMFYINSHYEQQCHSDEEFNRCFDQIVIDQFNGTIPVQ